jgi:hypothetical protein
MPTYPRMWLTRPFRVDSNNGFQNTPTATEEQTDGRNAIVLKKFLPWISLLRRIASSKEKNKLSGTFTKE